MTHGTSISRKRLRRGEGLTERVGKNVSLTVEKEVHGQLYDGQEFWKRSDGFNLRKVFTGLQKGSIVKH